jgi:FdhD protein
MAEPRISPVPGMTRTGEIERYRAGQRDLTSDAFATEEPLEIRVAGSGQPARSLAITMRTPGHDAELALGFLFGEALIETAAAVSAIEPCGPAQPQAQLQNIVRVSLAAGVSLPPVSFDRQFAVNSSCGLCGKQTLAALEQQQIYPIGSGFSLASSTLLRLPDALRRAQAVFDATGSLHAAALFDTRGELVQLREDVGRHNALDKLIGWALAEGRLPLADHALLLSGRVSFELVQKARRAGVTFMAAVGAPSSLAVEGCRRFGITLVGFLRDERFNVYTGAERVRFEVARLERPAAAD